MFERKSVFNNRKNIKEEVSIEKITYAEMGSWQSNFYTLFIKIAFIFKTKTDGYVTKIIIVWFEK